MGGATTGGGFVTNRLFTKEVKLIFALDKVNGCKHIYDD